MFTPVFSVEISNTANTENQRIISNSESNYTVKKNLLVNQIISKKSVIENLKQTSKQLEKLKNTDNYSNLENLYLDNKVTIEELIEILYEETKRLNTDNVKEILNVIKDTKNIENYYDDLVMLLHTVIEKDIIYLAKIIYFAYDIIPSIKDLNKIFFWTISEKLDLFFIKKLLHDGATFNSKNIINALGFAMLENRYDDFNTILDLIIKHTLNSNAYKDVDYKQNLFSILSSAYGQTFDDVVNAVMNGSDIKAIKLLLSKKIYNDDLLQFAKIANYRYMDIEIHNLLKNCSM
jgi:hypothetical protein